MGPINIDFDGIVPIFIGLVVLALFGAWKLVDIGIWLFTNLKISW